MPTALRSGPYRFFFYSNERGEPPHVHVQRDRGSAKFWLDPPSLARSRHLSAHELAEIANLITEHRDRLLEAWNEHHRR